MIAVYTVVISRVICIIILIVLGNTGFAWGHQSIGIWCLADTRELSSITIWWIFSERRTVAHENYIPFWSSQRWAIPTISAQMALHCWGMSSRLMSCAAANAAKVETRASLWKSIVTEKLRNREWVQLLVWSETLVVRNGSWLSTLVVTRFITFPISEFKFRDRQDLLDFQEWTRRGATPDCYPTRVCTWPALGATWYRRGPWLDMTVPSSQGIHSLPLALHCRTICLDFNTR